MPYINEKKTVVIIRKFYSFQNQAKQKMAESDNKKNVIQELL